MRQVHTDVLIAGGGLAGLLLARALRRRGRRVIVAADPARPPASHAAVGLLNPVIGQRFTVAWMAPQALPQARETYAAIGRDANATILRDLPILRALRDAEERAALAARLAAITAAGFQVREPRTTPHGWRRNEDAFVEIAGGGLVETQTLHEALLAPLLAADALVPAPCRPEDVEVTSTSVHWRSQRITAAALVLAGGAADTGPDGFVTYYVTNSPGREVPVRPVKGETLVLQAPGLERSAVLVAGHFLAPRGDHDRWVCGATQQPGVDDLVPSAEARRELESFLAARLDVPWNVVEHRVGVRPVTPDQRPIVGRLAPGLPVFVCNGLGARGVALGPWVAEAFAAHLTDNRRLSAEISLARFAPVPPDAHRWHAVDVARTIALLHTQPGDVALDLTVGNGGDTLWLADAVGPRGHVWGCDIQPGAIAAARRRIAEAASDTHIGLTCANHAELSRHLPVEWRGRVGVVVANLGHWSGSDSPIITQPETTVAAFREAVRWLRPAGALIAVCHVGHDGGREECAAVEAWAATLEAPTWRVTWHRHPAGESRAPRVLVVDRVS